MDISKQFEPEPERFSEQIGERISITIRIAEPFSFAFCEPAGGA